MKKMILLATMLALAALIMAAAPAMAAPKNNNDVKTDRQDLRADLNNPLSSSTDIRADRQDLRADRNQNDSFCGFNCTGDFDRCGFNCNNVAGFDRDDDFGDFDDDACIGVRTGFDCIGVGPDFDEDFDHGNLNDCQFIGFDRNGNALFRCETNDFCDSGIFDGFGNCEFFPEFNEGPGIFQGIGNESETGNVSLSFNVSQTGNNSNQCVTPLQFGNTGSNQNAQGFTSVGGTPFNNGFENGFFDDFGVFHPSFDGFGNDVELEGGNFTFAPVLNASCDQSVQQSSAVMVN